LRWARGPEPAPNPSRPVRGARTQGRRGGTQVPGRAPSAPLGPGPCLLLRLRQLRDRRRGRRSGILPRDVPPAPRAGETRGQGPRGPRAARPLPRRGRGAPVARKPDSLGPTPARAIFYPPPLAPEGTNRGGDPARGGTAREDRSLAQRREGAVPLVVSRPRRDGPRSRSLLEPRTRGRGQHAFVPGG